jgi:hypothetical protein
MVTRRKRRKERLLRDLRGGTGKSALKPMEVVARLDALLALGERPSDLRPLVAGRFQFKNSPELLALVAEAQATFGFDPRAWRILGVKLPRSEEEKQRRE